MAVFFYNGTVKDKEQTQDIADLTAKVESLHDIESTKPSRTYGQAKIYNYLIIKQVNQYIYGQNSKIVSKQSL